VSRDAPDERRGLLAVAVLLGLALLGGAVWVLLPRLLSAAGGLEPEILAQLRAAEGALPPLEVPGSEGRFVPRSLQFDRVTVIAEGERATVISTLDATGMLNGVAVSSLGRERTTWVRDAGRWRLEGPLAPSLVGGLAALTARARALDGNSAEALALLVIPPDRPQLSGDPRLSSLLGAVGHRWEPHAWYLRSERNELMATEEAFLVRPQRPPEPRTARLRLVASETAGRFLFSGSVL
jgi:hypothetical protein